MSLHRFAARQVLPVDAGMAWRFFADPRNLPLITPLWLRLRLTGELPADIHPGLIVTYSVSPVAGVPLDWVTEITNLVEGKLFVDEQRSGPYRFWHHQHHFRAVADGVEVRDILHYALPLGPLGDLANALLVRRRIGSIFAYRLQWLTRQFGGTAAAPNGLPMPADAVARAR